MDRIFRSLYDDDIFGQGVLVDTKITRIDIALDELIVKEQKNFDLYVLKEKWNKGLWIPLLRILILAGALLMKIKNGK